MLLAQDNGLKKIFIALHAKKKKKSNKLLKYKFW